MINGVHGLIFTDSTSYGMLWQRSIGAYQIASTLRAAGYTIQVIDFWSFLTLEGPDTVLRLIDKFVGSDTMFIGFSTTFMNMSRSQIHREEARKNRDNNKTTAFNARHIGQNTLGASAELLDLVKARAQSKNPKIDIVVGGARSEEGRDLIGTLRIVGYGEIQMLDYLKWKTGTKPLWSPSVEDGVRVANYNAKADGFDFVNSRMVWTDRDCVQPDETLPIEISRGCIFSCKFCAYPLNGKTKLDYTKDTQILRDEFLYNYEQWGITRYLFCDDTYNDTTQKLEWMNEVQAGLPFQLEFGTYARLDLVNAHPEQIDLLYQNGLRNVFFGIESLNYESAKSIGKGLHPDKAVDLLWRLREAWGNDVLVTSGFILGLPHDTYATMEAWLERISDHRFPLHSYALSSLGINNLKDKKRSWYSEFDSDPAKYGYEFVQPDKPRWVNSRYGTSTEGCNKMTEQFSLYSLYSGRLTIPSHTGLSLKDYGWTSEQQILESREVSLRHSPLANRVFQRFLNYTNALFRLEQE